MLSYGGAQLNKTVRDELMKTGVSIACALGTTEAGPYPQILRSDNEWEWFTFPEKAGTTFERCPGDDDVYELVFYRTADLERLQQVFLTFPEQDTLRTKDLFYKHQNLKNTWKIAGRTEDFFKLKSGYGVFATPVEESIVEKAWHLIYAAILAGAGHERPCLLVASRADLPTNSLIFDLWPIDEEVNNRSGELAKLHTGLIRAIDPAKSFKTNAKGAVARRETLLEYHNDIEEMYNRQIS